MELVQQLTQQLGINQQQASGGLGLLMGMAKNKLGGDFGQVAQHVPGVDNLINSAPKTPGTQATQTTASTGGGTGGGISGALGAVGGMLGGKSGLGSLGGLASGFQQLGLDPGMIGKFIPVVLGFFQSKGGSAKGLMERALSPA